MSRLPARARSAVRGEQGFVLLELILALVVVSLIAALALPRAREDSLTTVRGKAMEIAGLLRADRNAALRSGRPVVSLVDLQARTIRSGEAARSVTVPARYAFAVSDGFLDGVRFEPDSRARGGEIRLAPQSSQDRTSVVVRVDAFTAKIEIREDGSAYGG